MSSPIPPHIRRKTPYDLLWLARDEANAAAAAELRRRITARGDRTFIFDGDAYAIADRDGTATLVRLQASSLGDLHPLTCEPATDAEVAAVTAPSPFEPVTKDELVAILGPTPADLDAAYDRAWGKGAAAHAHSIGMPFSRLPDGTWVTGPGPHPADDFPTFVAVLDAAKAGKPDDDLGCHYTRDNLPPADLLPRYRAALLAGDGPTPAEISAIPTEATRGVTIDPAGHDLQSELCDLPYGGARFTIGKLELAHRRDLAEAGPC